ncbi:cytochrome c oxidase assembly protein [Acidimicrobiia bacterium EGI L10123]|uniref:cytochrome c oxidase assembly protein n=1 Tax=Salinilacustrithrix flava TaxID=2957203 RepID=UPI003D7C2831|nr:cytochrome c oxidase assembly protein [Acidimicrobiia bacterium EGI L10123]
MNAVGAAAVLAHGAVARDELRTSWGGDPLALLAVGALVLAYAAGARAAGSRAPLAALVRRRAGFGAVAVLVLLVSLASPLDAAASTVFSAHMVQHLLLTAVAAPLLVLAAPVATIRRVLPLRRADQVLVPAARLVARIPWWPLAATSVGLGVLSVWHVPALYEAALRSDLVHGLEHATLLGGATLLWSAVLGAARRRQMLWSAASLGLSALHGSALGALLALSTRPWYGSHAEGAEGWGIDPLADQQVAGAIMWVPTAAVHLGVLALLLHRWFRSAGERTPSPTAARAPTGPRARPTGAAASEGP